MATDQKVSISSLDIPDSLQKGVLDMGFTQCTPIQAETLPIALAGKDVAGQAQTGTGKTAAFLIACYNRLLREAGDAKRRKNQPRAIIIAPTRELAIQIYRDAEALGKYTEIRLGLAYGGENYEKQRCCIEDGVDILIGTPGRIIDYFKQKVFDLKAIQVLVLDEADRMFDLGFLKDIRFLLRRMPDPDKRLNMLFSATLSFRVHELSYEHMNNPTEIVIEAQQVTAEKVVESIYFPAKEEKIPLLLGLLAQLDVRRTMIFINTKRVGETVQAYLKGNGLDSAIISGDVPQKKRVKILQQFSEGVLPILIATDVAARGLHIPEVSHVFNYDLPQDPEDYVHRIGRTARAGATGDALSFACEEYSFSLMEIEEYIGHKIPVEPVTQDMLIDPKRPIREKQSKSDRPRTKHAKPRNSQGPNSGNRQQSRTRRKPTKSDNSQPPTRSD
ncbi:MAG: DEAD/DEAH box helicase [Thiohalomonadales bacterium]